MAMSLGNFVIGEEGQAVWRIYSSPISAKNLVKSKYFFIIFFSFLVFAITGIFGFVMYHPSLRATIVASFEAIFLVFALGSISLSNGIAGADFTETPRPRMIRQRASLLNLSAVRLSRHGNTGALFPVCAIIRTLDHYPRIKSGESIGSFSGDYHQRNNSYRFNRDFLSNHSQEREGTPKKSRNLKDSPSWLNYPSEVGLF